MESQIGFEHEDLNGKHARGKPGWRWGQVREVIKEKERTWAEIQGEVEVHMEEDCGQNGKCPGDSSFVETSKQGVGIFADAVVPQMCKEVVVVVVQFLNGLRQSTRCLSQESLCSGLGITTCHSFE
jgi:hypothetical protein